MSAGVHIGDGTCVGVTEKAVRVLFEDRRLLWIPQSQIHDDSEVYELNGKGRVVVSQWWAEQKGFADPPENDAIRTHDWDPNDFFDSH